MRHYSRNGFSLIEMLVVIAIIGILSGLLLTAVHGVRQQARKARARHDVDQIAAAWLTYLQEYRCFPKTVGISSMGPAAIQILRGSPPHADNIRGFAFLDYGTNTTHFADPWGTDYRVCLDGNNGNPIDNQVSVPVDGNVYLSVAVWSSGPDLTEGTSDDVTSWRK